jgi:hypothetical protein
MTMCGCSIKPEKMMLDEYTVTSNKQVTNVTCLFRTGNKSQTESLRLGGLLPLYVTELHQKRE